MLKKVLNRAFLTSNAAKLPDGSFVTLYAENRHLLDEMRSPSNQIIWGRRGTGKTHLLNAFVEGINNDDQSSEIAFYISCDRMARESPIESVSFPNEQARIKFYANETYKNFMYTLCNLLFDQYESLLQYKRKAIHTERLQEEYLDRVGSSILNLMDVCLKGVPRIDYITEGKNHIVSDSSSRESELQTEATSKIKSFVGSISGAFRSKRSRNTESAHQLEEKIRYESYLPSINKAIKDLIDEMMIDCLYVCIDELWLVDEKSSTSFQPFFLDNIRQTLGTQPKLGIKIASIRETTNLNNKTDVRLTCGMQSGNDIIELAHLDPVQSKMQDVYAMFMDMVTKRINYYISIDSSFTIPPDKEHLDLLDNEQVLKSFFKDERTFRSMVDMSHGIPRKFINMLNICLRRLDYDLASNYIHYYLISDVVIETYKNELRSDLPFIESNTVYSAIDHYVRSNKYYFFLIENKTVSRLKPVINTLLYNEIIHRIPSSETPLSIMNVYKTFYLDLGMYFLSVREQDFSEYEQIVESFRLKLPDDLNTSTEKYQLDLSQVPNSYVVCKHCNSIFSSTHPVFIKYGICPDCAQEISNELLQ